MASELLEEYDKFLYLDCDTLVRGDISDLYKVDLTDYFFGMAKDIDYIGHYCSEEEWKSYTDKVLKLKSSIDYYQSGVMVFNAKKVREELSSEKLLEMLLEKNYRFPDQDLLNVVGEGKIKDIGLEWNFLANYKQGDFSRKKNIISKAPKQLYNFYLKAEKNPKIIHFCIPIELRPWFNPSLEFGSEYWQMLRKSYFYEIILSEMFTFNKGTVPLITPQESSVVKVVDENGIKIEGINEVIYIRGVYIKMIQKMNKWFPMNSKKRKFLRKIGNKLFR